MPPAARLWLSCAALFALVGCAGAPPLPATVGSSHTAREADAATPGAAERPRWEHADEAPTWPRVGAAWFASRGHFVGTRTAEVHVAPLGEAGYAALSPATELAAGTVVAELTRDAARATPGPTLVMVRREAGYDVEGHDWEYVVVDSGGRVEARGPLPACRRCHAEAPSRFLFGAPREAPPAPQKTNAASSPG